MDQAGSDGRASAVSIRRDRFRQPIQRHEAAEPWTFLLAEQHLIQAAEPGAQIRDGVPLADLIDDDLDRFGIGAWIHAAQRLGKVRQGSAFNLGRLPVALRRPDEVAVIGDSVANQAVEERLGFRRGLRGVAADEAP